MALGLRLATFTSRVVRCTLENHRERDMSAGKKSTASSSDAIAVLTADHKRVKAMFKEFASLKEKRGNNVEQKAELVGRICEELKVHTAIEEEIFYPAVRE